jgi:hypothetical protein
VVAVGEMIVDRSSRKRGERFWSKVQKTDGCWSWMANRTIDGYGVLRLGDKNQRVHRIMWELTYGPIPVGLNVLHHCDNPGCVNPEHLFLGSQKDNGEDMSRKGRAPRGERQGGHKLTEAHVRKIRESTDSERVIARRFNIDRSTAHRVKKGEAWAWLK